MAATLAGNPLDGVQEIPAGDLLVGAEADIEVDIATDLYLHLAASDTTLTTGVEIIVQTNSLAAGDETWVDKERFRALVGTAANEVLSVGEPQGETVIVVADTTGFITKGAWLFLEDITLFSDSEWVLEADYAVNTSITAANGLANAHLINSILYNLASTHLITLPIGAFRMRVLYNNEGAATIAIRSDIVDVTGV